MQGLVGILDAYKRQPTEALLTETVLLTTNGTVHNRIKEAAAANLGYTRGGLYLDTARSLIRYIEANDREISWRKGAYDVLLPIREIAYRNKAELPLQAFIELETVVAAIEGAKYLAKDAEILWHFYAVSLDRATHFFANAAIKIGLDIAVREADQEYFAIIRAFRNHMEHREKSIASLAGPDWFSMFQESADGVTFGYSRDNNGNVQFTATKGPLQGRPLSMPLNLPGFEKFARIIQQGHESIEAKCIDALEQYFAQHPDSIPQPEHVGNLMSETLSGIQ